MEKDDEVKGGGNSYTTEFRQYDARVGRWLSLDPLMAKFPWQSPYVAFDNNPIYFNDPNGAESKGNGDPPGLPAKKKDSNGNESDWAKYDNFTDSDGNSWTLMNRDGEKMNWQRDIIVSATKDANKVKNKTEEIEPKPIINPQINNKYKGEMVADFTLENTKKFIRGTERPIDYTPEKGVTVFDCTAWVSYVFKQTGYDKLSKASSGGTSGLIPYMKNNGGIRLTNPKVGDIAVWNGHVEIITAVKGNSFSTSGSSGGNGGLIPTNKTFKSINDIQLNYYGVCGPKAFLGFWTPIIK